ncbi:SPOR domain-containing protein [Vreelandella nigrificans]|uniref:SPOR domain-containing protein n=1 Tax=Vreelandella nigrificans TaxID=2042704 RepID=A0A2A4HLH5_9GAMM|nr:SPOR domain-containing protein [Halomonas nigrificans]PCF94904.1 SPOR domain-containing protein [Halomonas nigrificans]
MKYGKTERISGIVILLALLAIFVPWLMSDPAPREERPQPTFVIEQPVQVARQDVPAPEMPSTINALPTSESSGSDTVISTPIDAAPRQPDTAPVSPPANDPIAELVAANSSGNTSSSSNASSSSSSASSSGSSSAGPATTQRGEWAIQVGSFGDATNAQRLGEQLGAEGFSTYQRERENNLTTVYVGPYATSEDGEAAMALIKQRANVQGLLVRVRD